MRYGFQTWSEKIRAVCDDDLHGGQMLYQMSNVANYAPMATKLGQKNPSCKFMVKITAMEVKGHKRSNVVKCVRIYLVKRISVACKFKRLMSFMDVNGQERSL